MMESTAIGDNLSAFDATTLDDKEVVTHWIKDSLSSSLIGIVLF